MALRKWLGLIQVAAGMLWGTASFGQAPPSINDQRILGIIPNYQTVNDSTQPVAPLTAGQKWAMAAKSAADPFNVASAILSAGFSQAGNQTPRYGEGWSAYEVRVGAALADLGTQNFFGGGVLACLLHQDPRYFRRGPQSRVWTRVLYSASRVVVARQDSGRAAINASGLGGMVLGIAASNAYYPTASQNGRVMAERLNTSLTGWLSSNLMAEFWPDIQHKFFHRHAHN